MSVKYAKVPMDGRIIDSKPFSCLPGDKHLTVVLVETDRDFITWLYHAQNRGYFWGHYYPKFHNTEAQNDAHKDFAKRCALVIV